MENEFSISPETKKSSNKTWLVLGIIVIVLLSILLIFNATGNSTGKAVSGNEKPVVKIGVSAPLSGDLGFLGEGVKNSMLLAQEDMKKDTKYEYKLIFEDDKINPKEASTTANKLIGVDNVNAIVSFSSGIGNVISPIAEENNVLHINVGASDPNVAKGEYNFIHWTSPPEETRVFIKELQNRGIKKLAIVLMNQQGAIATIEDLKDRLSGTGIQVVSEERFNLGTKDFKTVLMKAKESNPDIYLFYAFSPELEIMTRQAKELDVTHLTAIEAFELTNQPELFEGMWYVNVADAGDKFTNAYKEKYGKNPSIASANAYDVYNLIVQSYENAGANLPADKKPTSEQAANELSNIKGYSGAVGPLTINAEGIIDSKAVVREIKNGKPVTIGA